MNASLVSTDREPDEPVRPKSRCLTRRPVTADELNRELGLMPGSIKATDLRDEETGFRAALYRDETSGKLFLVTRDTQPKSLADWQTNTRNGEGKGTDQYAAMQELSRTLTDRDIPFNAAGYSKGGGAAQPGCPGLRLQRRRLA